MGLRSDFDELLGSEQFLLGLNGLIWQHLCDATDCSEHPWHQASFSTIDVDALGLPMPRTRTVVLRRSNSATQQIDFYTDVRSAKVRQLELPPTPAQVCWLFYDLPTRIQLRLTGTAELIGGAEAEAAWNKTPTRSRSAYLSIDPPGTLRAGGDPPDTSDRDVSEAESERGRQHFRIVRTSMHSADWLYLRREGHVRALVDYRVAGQPRCQWLVP